LNLENISIILSLILIVIDAEPNVQAKRFAGYGLRVLNGNGLRRFSSPCGLGCFEFPTLWRGCSVVAIPLSREANRMFAVTKENLKIMLPTFFQCTQQNQPLPCQRSSCFSLERVLKPDRNLAFYLLQLERCESILSLYQPSRWL